MSSASHDLADLSKNQSLVLHALEQADAPLSAYSILDLLRDKGFRAPLQVYRALEKLIEFGMVHRLESLNAFVACRRPDDDDHHAVAFTICETCGQVSEISDQSLTRRLLSLSKETGFQVNKLTLELRGLCQQCQSG